MKKKEQSTNWSSPNRVWNLNLFDDQKDIVFHIDPGLSVLQRETESACGWDAGSKEDYRNAHSNVIHSSKQLETSLESINRINQQILL